MRSVLAVTFALTLGGPASAGDFVGTRPLGMGGAHRAVVTSNDAIMLNPAGMSQFRHYAFEAQYLIKPDWSSDNGPEEHIFHASVVDNQIAAFATGLAYTRVERGESKKGNRYDLAFSVPLTEQVLIGTNFKYINFNRDGIEDSANAVTIDAGLLLRFDFGLSLGVAGYNLTNPADYLEHPLSMAVGVCYSPFRALELAFDWTINFQQPVDSTEPLGEKQTAYSYHFGVEYLLLGAFLLRAGYVIDNANPWEDEQYWAGGLGYVTKTFAVEFGYQGSIHHTWNNTFGIAVRLFM